MAHAIGSATVSFGLVSIPVKLFASTESSSGVSFNLLHGKCGTRLKQRYHCATCDAFVGRDEMVKGYEYSEDKYVTFTDEELETLAQTKSDAIDIAEFVPIASVDPVYYEKAYYLGPAKGGEKAYRLLAKAMEKTGRSAVARYAARGKQYLVLLRPRDGRLVMQQLHYDEEVRSQADIPAPEVEVKEPELDLACRLVDQITAETFKPAAYTDPVKKRALEAIQRKVEGQQVIAAPAEAPQAQVTDLMEALKASLVTAKPRDERLPPLAKPPRGDEAASGEATRKVS